MADYQDPPLRLRIEGMRWMGDAFEPVGTSAEVTLYGTDSDEDAVAILRHLRAHVAQRLDLTIPALALLYGELDFTAPNAPTEQDVEPLVGHARRLLADLEALRELAAEVVDDDDDEGDDDRGPEPDPEPSALNEEVRRGD